MRWYIGTSGWSYARWKGIFYPGDIPATQYLPYYAQYFNAVEINNTFYHLATAHQMQLWESGTPHDFTFAVKASGYITHRKRLNEPAKTVPPFIDSLALKKKQGPLIFQLPPRFHKNIERLQDLIRALPRRYRYAVEFRDPDWHADDVYTLLRKHNIAFCLFEKGPLRSPRLTTADFVYVRLHGRQKNYKGNYSRAVLTHWRDWLAEQRKDVYIFFDNTDEKLFAIENAQMFRQLAAA